MRILLPIGLLMAVALALPTVTAATFDSGDIQPGGTWSHTFSQVNEAGYNYHCHPHPWMTGMVHVLEDDTPGTETHHVDIEENGKSADWGYSIQHLSIEVGDTVVWTNTGAAVHTVTQMDGGSHDHGDHDHGEDKDSPGPGLLGLVALFGVAWTRRLRA